MEPAPHSFSVGPSPSHRDRGDGRGGWGGKETQTQAAGQSGDCTWVAGLLGPQGPLQTILGAAARLPLGLPGSHTGHRHQGDGLALLGWESSQCSRVAPGLALSAATRGRTRGGRPAQSPAACVKQQEPSGLPPGHFLKLKWWSTLSETLTLIKKKGNAKSKRICLKIPVKEDDKP